MIFSILLIAEHEINKIRKRTGILEMEITKGQIKKMLWDDYIDSFAQFAKLVLEISNSTEKTDLENIINDIDKIVWNIRMKVRLRKTNTNGFKLIRLYFADVKKWN